MSEFAFISHHIRSHFSAIPVAGEESVPHLCAKLDWGSDVALVGFSQSDIEVSQTQQTKPDFTIYLSDFETLKALLEGKISPMQAFSNEQLRSDGYIVWTFRLLMALARSPT